MPLNILDADFEEKRRALDKSVRRSCAGCVYSCYYVVQNSFRPGCWPDVLRLWWDANTEPGGPERSLVRRFGWLAGFVALAFPGLARRLQTVE